MMPPTGLVKVLLVGARDLDCVDPYNQRPYCILEYGGQKFRSKSCTTHGKDPIWNNAYKFLVSDDNWVKVTIKDEVSKRVLGVVDVHIGRALQYGKDEVYLPVRTPDNFEQGVLNAKLRFSLADDNDPRAPKQASGASTPTSRTPPGSRPGSATSSRAFSGSLNLPDVMYGDETRNSYSRSTMHNGVDHSTSSNGSLNPFAGPSPSQPPNPFTSSAPPNRSTQDDALVEDLIKNNQKLSTQNKDLKMANDDQGKLLQLRNAELVQINNVLDDSQKENSELRLDVEKLKKQIAALEDFEQSRAAGSAVTKDELQKKLSLAEYERQQAEDELSIVQERYEKLLEDTSQLRLNLSNLQAEVTTLRSDLAFAQQEKATLQAAVSGMQSSSNSSVDQVMGQLEAAHKQLSELSTSKEELAKKLAAAEAQLESGASQSEEMEYLQTQVRKAWSQNLELQSKVRALEAAVSEAAGTSGTAAHGRANGTGLRTNGNTDKDRESKHIAELMGENEFLKEALIEAKLEVAQVKERNDQIRQELRVSQSGLPPVNQSVGSSLGERLAKQKSTLQKFLSNTMPSNQSAEFERVQA